MTRSFPAGAVIVGAAALVAGVAFMAATSQAQTMLQGPVNVSPSNGVTLTSAQFTMADWSDVTSTTTSTSTIINYHYESSLSSTTDPDGSFTSPLFESGTLSSSSISTAGTAEGTYYWHARAIDNMGSTSPWSPVWSVTIDNDATTTGLVAPTNVSPTNGMTLTSAEWDIADWTDVSGTSSPVTYRYESSHASSTDSDGSFTSPVFESGTLTASQINTSGTAEGTYWWHARAVAENGVMSDWSMPFKVIVDNNNNGTSTPDDNAQALIDELEDLQDEYPQFFWKLQWLINDLADENGGGTTTPPQQGTPSIDNNGTTVPPGGHLDFVGRNFGREETVNITLNAVLLRTAHADGGGNFSTGSMSAPTTPGTYTYVFTGATSGKTANSVITVQ